MAYGYRKRYTKRYTRRATRRTRARATSSYKKMGRRFIRQPRFALAGYARDVEKKYYDQTMQLLNREFNYGFTKGETGGLAFNTGVSWVSQKAYRFATDRLEPSATPTVIKGSVFAGLGQGTTVSTRIGNKITVKYVKGTIQFLAALTYSNQGELKAQGGEQMVSGDAADKSAYLRTSIRYAIVKDTQINNTEDNVLWDNVFKSEVGSYGTGGIYSELNVENMGRFIVLEDRTIQLDANNPMKTVKFKIDGSKIGKVRYNGPSGTNNTDKSIHVIYAATTSGGQSNVFADVVQLPPVVISSRTCFTDS